MKKYLFKGIGTLMLCVLFLSHSFAQNKVVSGTIKDEKGAFLSGVTVSLTGSKKVVITDASGKFSISVPEGSKELKVSFVGMETQVVPIAAGGNISVVLKAANNTLSDVVVVGYGTARKKDLTGSVGSVKSDQITQVATADVGQAIQGRLAGVQVIANSGEPGGGVQIRIRGVGSVNGSDPIYVVDGYQTGDISFLAPADIESIDVLKDASATAIYGSRGANGVVLVTTKKGKKGPIKFNVDSYVGNQKAWNTIKMTNAMEYATLVLQAYTNDGVATNLDATTTTRLNYVLDNKYHGTDWQKEVMQSGFMQNHSLTISGGGDQNRFRLSGTYFSQDGIVKNSSLKKYFINFNNDLTINKWLTAGISAAFTHFDKTYFNSDLYTGVLTTALSADPLAAAWDKTTNNWGRADISYTNNPARSVDELKNNKGYGNEIVANAYLQAKITKEITFRTQIGATSSIGHNKSYSPQFYIDVVENRSQSSLWERRSEGQNWAFTNYVTYNKIIGNHSITAMVGAELQEAKYNDFSATAYNVPADADLQYLSASQNTLYNVTSGQVSTALESFFGRVNYSYNSKYLLTGTLRRDGSSRFLGKDKWGTFPSVAAAWVASDESFMKQFNSINLLKLRAGWGQVANDQGADAYGYTTSVTGNNLYVFGGTPIQGYAPNNLSNPQIRWEKSEQSNFGLDLAVLKSKITFTADYFDRKTKDMIVAAPIPQYVGTGSPKVNAGSMQNRGVELSVNYRNGNAFKYAVGVNVSFIKNKLTSLGGQGPVDGGSVGKIGNTTRSEEGMPFPYFYGLKTDGIFHSQADVDAYKNTTGGLIQPSARPGDVKFIDANGDGTISDADKVNLGNPYPTMQFGFNAECSYKGFDMKIFVQGVQGNHIINGMLYNTRNVSNSGGGWNNFEKIRLYSWTVATPNNNEPRMTAADPNNNMRFSDRYVMDGSYLRMKNLQIGYSLPKNLLQKYHVNGIRIYVSADNLFTLTKYEGFDPEVGSYYGNPYSYGVDVGTYPQARTFRAGFNLNF